ncbi:DNA-directed RNA polymerases I and III subunit RPAC1 [Patellaria atrata CBS 101060]|uniref:DNA-directed RNA polymerases I and III subunit RPAC1 n=1 Tax=Patellaria atrata CBS 101060 TaxID=1346257 RepID=A0A9P4S3S3_9PEZI|nr:DNA-directed RNA polymerases I and III subunit RPAC1 [Patellaria atrata CBS 101060]
MARDEWILREHSAQKLQDRKIIGINAETVTNIASSEFPNQNAGESHHWDIENFKKNFHVQFHKNDPFDSTFSLIGIDAPIANAFRRILISEISTVAIEYVYVVNNTSIIQDEVLAARLGLIPLKGDREGLKWMRWFKRPTEDSDGGVPTDYNTVVLGLDVECTWKDGAKEKARRGENDPKILYNNSSVYASQITFRPTGQQSQRFPAPDGIIQAVNPDILIAKLRPGQKISLSMHCIKGIGADHAKFSPVATATYRLLPHIDIIKPIVGASARKFSKCFPKGVINLEPVTAEEASREGSGYEGYEGEPKAVVLDPMKDTVSRECLRHDEFKSKVKLGRIRDHFIFSVESTGQWESDELFLESVRVLKVKCMKMKKGLEEMIRQ